MKNKGWMRWAVSGGLLIVLVLAFIFIKKIYPYPESIATTGTSSEVKLDVEPYETPAIQEEYDVIVVGGEPEGVAAAVSAARNGSKTLLIEHRDGLGGLFTYGALNFLDVSHDINGNWANQGTFLEWFKLVDKKIGFDIDVAKVAFMKMVQDEKNLTLSLNTKLNDAVMDGNTLTGITFTTEDGKQKTVSAKRFVDATQDADLAVKSGTPYFKGGADIGLEDRKMAVTLVMHFKGVDWAKFTQASKDGVFGGGEVHGNVAWGYGKFHRVYKANDPMMRLRGLNVVRQEDGTLYINALQIFGINGLLDSDKERAIEMGKEETRHILKYLQKNFPGFENAEIASFPEELYVRETRHVLAEYQLPMTDVWENNDHWDSIGFGAYPVDVQATSPADYGFVVSAPEQYAIPFRSLVPLKTDNLLIASKAAGYSSIAAGSARVVPVGMTLGDAAGAASALSIENAVTFRKMSQDKELIKELQTTLKDQGANIYPFNVDFPYKGEWFYNEIKPLINYGLIFGGYKNEFPVKKPISEGAFGKLMSNGVKHMLSDQTQEFRTKEMNELIGEETDILTRNKAAQMILVLNNTVVSNEDAWDVAIEKGFIDETLQKRLKNDKKLQGSEGYYLAAHALTMMQKKN
ncbi:FAD-dependent oxidoreductase [Fictibacillus nanhaiensis]|uniref:FAD-dependent oxidoreductase n=1 Tax=Fictibacillus nanhaiensis TaxID=742169 RepID=UPI00203DBAD9|nr:FAD-dependent oxidoreductase [Fictibacillus nanhaiensis]MCM3734142.1 FAD-dependent oxidoreductase [Fictibacillus nanhaiensis]